MAIPFHPLRRRTVRILAGVEVKPTAGSWECSGVEFTVDAEPERSVDVVSFRTPFYYEDTELYRMYVIITSLEGQWAIYVRRYEPNGCRIVAPKQSADVEPLTYTTLRKETDGRYWIQVDIPEVMGAVEQAVGVAIR